MQNYAILDWILQLWTLSFCLFQHPKYANLYFLEKWCFHVKETLRYDFYYNSWQFNLMTSYDEVHVFNFFFNSYYATSWCMNVKTFIWTNWVFYAPCEFHIHVSILICMLNYLNAIYILAKKGMFIQI